MYIKKNFFMLFFTFFVSITCFAQDFDSFENEFNAKQKDVYDPLEGYNRVMTDFNDFVYMNVLEPTARGYANVVPETARTGLSNFFYNLGFPIRFVNNILQFKFGRACEELGRFTINSTFGLLGFLDPATRNLNMDSYKEDFGQTLGFYGVGEGIPIVLPFLGPSNIRDILGTTADGYVSPLTDTSALNYKIPNNAAETLGIRIVHVVNETSLNLGVYENLKKDAIDLYPFLRDTYSQKREKEIRE